MRVTEFTPLDRIIGAIAHLSLLGGGMGAYFFMLQFSPQEELAELMDIFGTKTISLRDLTLKVYHHDWMPQILPRLDLLDNPVMKHEISLRFQKLQMDSLARMVPFHGPASLSPARAS